MNDTKSKLVKFKAFKTTLASVAQNCMTTLKFNSSRNHDIAIGICIGKGYRFTRVRDGQMPFKLRVHRKLAPKTVETIYEQASRASSL